METKAQKTDTVFSCKSCLRGGFKDGKDLRYHENDCGQFTCHECDFECCSKISMQNHKAIHQKKFECKTCGKCFGKGYNLKLHQQVHDVGKERLKCPKCQNTFTLNDNLARHLKKHHN